MLGNPWLAVVAAALATVMACGGRGLTGSPVPSPSLVPPLHPSVDGYPEAVVTLAAPDKGRTVPVAVKVANTDGRRQHGLMEVPALPEGTGMLFVYARERTGGFWMKNTRIPLDIAFANADGDVRAVLTMTPCREDPCPLYDPGVSYRYALEVARGWLERVGVEEGWRLQVPVDLP